MLVSDRGTEGHSVTPGTASTEGGTAGPGARDALHPLWQWDVFFAFSGIAMATLTLLSEGPFLSRVGAAAALLALCGWYIGYARRHLLRDEEHPPLLLPVGALVIFGAALAFHPMAQLGWGVLFPMLYLGCRPTVAASSAALAAALPSVVLLIRSGPDDPSLPFSLAIGAGAGGAAILFGAWIGQVMERSTQRAALIAQLESSREEVELLSHEAGIAEERTRLAREIHDTLAQRFTSIVTLVQAAESELDEDLPAARHHLELATRTARENLAEARAMVAALTPSPLASAPPGRGDPPPGRAGRRSDLGHGGGPGPGRGCPPHGHRGGPPADRPGGAREHREARRRTPYQRRPVRDGRDRAPAGGR